MPRSRLGCVSWSFGPFWLMGRARVLSRHVPPEPLPRADILGLRDRLPLPAAATYMTTSAASREESCRISFSLTCRRDWSKEKPGGQCPHPQEWSSTSPGTSSLTFQTRCTNSSPLIITLSFLRDGGDPQSNREPSSAPWETLLAFTLPDPISMTGAGVGGEVSWEREHLP